MSIRAVLIDLDGTLVDTLGEITDAANAMLADAGRPPVDADVISETVGEGAAMLVDLLLGPGSAERWLPVYLAHYRVLNGTKAALYPNVVEGLAAMRAQGLAIACVTNKPRELVAPLLAHLGIAASFDATIAVVRPRAGSTLGADAGADTGAGTEQVSAIASSSRDGLTL
jgi:phosphoglycolate phosphatase